MGIMQAVRFITRLNGEWKFAIGHDINTQSFWMDLAINEGGKWVVVNVNLGKSSRPNRSRFIYLWAFGKLRYFKYLDKKTVG